MQRLFFGEEDTVHAALWREEREEREG